MKIIKLFLLVAISLCTTVLLHAQNIKTEIAKPVEIKQQTTAEKSDSPMPELKHLPGFGKEIGATAKAEISAPLKQHEYKELGEDIKPVALTVDVNQRTKNLTPQQLNTQNGKAEKPAKPVPAPSTVDPNFLPPPVTKSAQKHQQQ